MISMKKGKSRGITPYYSRIYTISFSSPPPIDNRSFKWLLNKPFQEGLQISSIEFR